jgi:histone arginine demethylase JMJD6
MKIPHVHLKKYQQKISNRKRAARSELGLQEWSAQGLHKQDFIDILIDNCPRIDYEKVSKEEFVTKYEIPNIPCVIQNGMKEWPAMTEWTVTKLAYRYRHEKFKVGEDDDEKVVYLGLKYYFHYALKDPHGAAIDDSPLYIFDATFGKRSIHHSARRSEVDSDSRHRYDPNSSQAPCHLVEDYQVPKYFTDDLFSLAEGRRPPFRWLVIGPARSGTGIHVDPLGTSAWNALISGHKRY